MHEVTVIEPGFCTPLMVIQRWLHTLQISRTKGYDDKQNSRRIHDYCDAARLNCLLHGDGDLLCEAFLHLQPSTEGHRDARKLREAEHELVWNIRDGHLQ